MTQDIQETLFQLFESVRHDPDTLPAVSLDGWQEGSKELCITASSCASMERGIAFPSPT
jgi:hypothetical protein